MCPNANLYIILWSVDDNMVDPLSAKLGEFDINDPANINGNIERQDESSDKNIYLPAVSKEILE
jgi:hypothetical protein